MAIIGLSTVPRFDQPLRQASRPEPTKLNARTMTYLAALVIAATVAALLPAADRVTRSAGCCSRSAAAGIARASRRLADGYARYGLVVWPGVLPAARYLAIYSPATLVIAMVCVGFILLLTPSGSLPSPRWRRWAMLTAAALIVLLAGLTRCHCRTRRTSRS